MNGCPFSTNRGVVPECLLHEFFKKSVHVPKEAFELARPNFLVD